MRMTSLLIALATLTACREERPVAKPLSAEESVARGKHLTLVSGCNDCHTPWKPTETGAAPDFSRELSGHPASLEMPPPPQLPAGPWLVTASATNTAWAGPWGVSFTANLTPDPETGIGKWSKQNFIDTIRNGRHLGAGRPILPPMPAAMYANYSDADLGAIYDYLMTLPPIVNQVPAPVAPRS